MDFSSPYRMDRPGTTRPWVGRRSRSRKLSFVKQYEPWSWIVASGLYLDDVDDAASAEVWRTVVLVAQAVEPRCRRSGDVNEPRRG